MTPCTVANKHTAMDEATSTSSPLSPVLVSPLVSDESHESRLPLVTRLSTPEHIMSKPADSNVAVSAMETSPGAPSVTALKMIENRTDKRSNKRIREEHATEENAQPRSKKPATEADVKATHTAPTESEALDETTVDHSDGIATGNGASSADELAESKTSTKKSKPKRKTAPAKKAATSRRVPACATCKKRKVRHTLKFY